MKFVLPAAAVAALSLLSACGGGNPPPATGGEGVTLSGVVAVGAPIPDGAIEAWCPADDLLLGTARTDARGAFRMTIAQPCSGGVLLHTTGPSPLGEPLVAFDPDASVTAEELRNAATRNLHVNVTPLTTVVAQAYFDVEEIREMKQREIKEKLKTPDEKRKAKEERDKRVEDLLEQFKKIFTLIDPRLLTMEKLLREKFTPEHGDPMDDLIEKFVKERGGVTVAALLEQARARGGNLADGLPWKTLFGGRTSLTFNGTDCTASGTPMGEMTASLRMDGKKLVVDVVSDAGGPVTITVGPDRRSSFWMEVTGNSPVVQLNAREEFAGDISFQLDAGEPVIGFDGMECKLSNPLQRSDLAAFHVPARVTSAVPDGGVRGTCTSPAPAYDYEITALGDIRIDGRSLAPDWLDAAHAQYREDLQYQMAGGAIRPAFQIRVAPLPSGQALQPYYYYTVPYGMFCTSVG